MKPLVSIVIPAFNPGHMIDRCLQTCLRQTYRPLEIIIVDNNCTDQTRERVVRNLYGHDIAWRLIRCSEQGASNARNAGYQWVRGKYVQWMDSDDELHPDKIARQVHALETQPDADIAISDIVKVFWKSGAIERRQRVTLPREADDMIMRFLANGIWVTPSSYLFSRRASDRLHELMAWHPERKVNEDREYMGIAALIGLKFLHVPESIFFYNLWSTKAQLSFRTNIAAQAHAHEAIFKRLQEVAATHTANLTEDHWYLLRQPWTLYKPVTVPCQKWKLQDGRLLIRDQTGNIKSKIAAESDKAFEIISKFKASCFLQHYAWEQVNQQKLPFNAYVSCMKFAERLRNDGWLIPNPPQHHPVLQIQRH